MFKHILVPTDLTDRNRKAMDIAISMAKENCARITLLHVVETFEDPHSKDFQKFFKQLGTRAGKQMDKIIAQYASQGITPEKQVLYGRRVYEIINFAANDDVDLIILSSHKLDPENMTEGWGTISFKVGVLSHCPVMLVK
jgi:nucleotide-binding universal stress UspA family protein